jgi:hypothetical protein
MPARRKPALPPASPTRAPLPVSLAPDVTGQDLINHPPHYTQGGIECLEAIKASMPYDQFIGYLKGSQLKYVWRYEHKGGVEDLKKANFYLNRLIREIDLKTAEALTLASTLLQ